MFDMGDLKESSKDFDKKSLRVKAELKQTNGKNHKTNIHSICWEDSEAAEG
jgi:hypothetical protein